MTLTADIRGTELEECMHHVDRVPPFRSGVSLAAEAPSDPVAPQSGAMVAFARFREECGRSATPVVCYVEDSVLCNAAGAGVLALVKESTLRFYAARVAADGRPVRWGTVLANGERARAHFEAVSSGSRTVGVLIRMIVGAPAMIDSHDPLPALVGESAPWRAAVRQAVGASNSELPALLFGERGTGKAALALAALAQRYPDFTIRSFDCAVMVNQTSAHLLHEAAAGSGPLVLKHIDALPDTLQGEVARLARDLRAEGRVLWCTANGHLKSLAKRCDLDVFDHLVELPPLRHRVDDIALLLAHTFRTGGTTFTPPRLTPEATELLMRYRWPQNVSQLMTVLRGAAAMGSRPWIGAQDLPLYIQRDGARHRLSPYENAEADVIRHALKVCGGNKVSAADLLGISRSTIYRKIRRYDLEFRRAG